MLYAACFIWAVRNGQFTELDRQRYIAIGEDDLSLKEDEAQQPGTIDRYILFFIILLAAVLFSSAVWMAFLGRGG